MDAEDRCVTESHDRAGVESKIGGEEHITRARRELELSDRQDSSGRTSLRFVNDSRLCKGTAARVFVYFPVAAKRYYVNDGERSTSISTSERGCTGATARPAQAEVATERSTRESSGLDGMGMERKAGKGRSPMSPHRICRIERAEGEVFPIKEKLRLIGSSSHGAECKSRESPSP